MAKYLDTKGLTHLIELIKNGMALKSHKHSAADITSGTLPVTRGGTGGTDAVSARTGLSVYSKAEVDGLIENVGIDEVVPITKGGTGATTAENARTNLGITPANIGAAATSHSHSAATSSAAGFMSATDKSKLDSIASGANKTVVDTSLSETSTNPVQNKAVKTALDGKAESVHKHDATQINGLPPNVALVSNGVGDLSSSAVTATELGYLDGATSNIQTQLNSKAASTHKHSASDIASGTLSIARGGTGLTASPSMLVNLASTAADTVLEASTRPGITGTLPISHGGTGATTIEDARETLSVPSLEDFNSLRDSVSHAELEDGWRVINIGGAKIAFYKNTSPLFVVGNEFTKFFDVTFPPNLFTSEPIISVTKCQNTNTLLDISIHMNVFKISPEVVTVAICDGGGRIVSSHIVPFMLIAVGW